MMRSSPHASRAHESRDRESDVTWHHVIVYGCEGQNYFHASAHMPITGAGRPHVEGISTDSVVTMCTGVT